MNRCGPAGAAHRHRRFDAVRQDWWAVFKAHTRLTGDPRPHRLRVCPRHPAVHDGMRLRSGRVGERTRALRCTYTSTTPPGIVRDFDTLLHDT
ncbi:hypothetical protein [Streptomyces sp. CA-106131]|uniref:hypothetical protein n=1 Tax=Streptomyces sp. CA-106131 TaxID=3240045 RepID=UPI003D8EA9FB